MGLLAQHFCSRESCLVQYHHIVRPVSSWQVSLPAEIRQFVHASTGNYGKVKLVLQRNAFFVESPFPDVLHTLLQVCYQLISLCKLKSVDLLDHKSVLDRGMLLCA